LSNGRPRRGRKRRKEKLRGNLVNSSFESKGK